MHCQLKYLHLTRKSISMVLLFNWVMRKIKHLESNVIREPKQISALAAKTYYT